MVGEPCIWRIGDSCTKLVPATHAVALGRNESGADEGFGGIVFTGEVAGYSQQGLSGRHDIDHRPQHGIVADESHDIAIMVNAVLAWVTGPEQEIAGAEYGEMANPLHVVGFEAG